ncbi:MAG: hypothetical protein LBC92_00475, partial [Rickettsiales bacterium]|nr:hypothetical protein [Rickettsiales bacterium]
MDKFKNRMRINNNSLDVKNKQEFLEKQVSGIFDKQELVELGEKNGFESIEGREIDGCIKRRQLIKAKKSIETEHGAKTGEEKTYIRFRGEVDERDKKEDKKQKNEQLYSREIFNSILLNYLGQPTPNAYYGKSEKGESKVYMEKQKIEIEDKDLVECSNSKNKSMVKDGVDVYLQGKDLSYLPNTENGFGRMLFKDNDFLRKHIRSNIINYNLGTSCDRNMANLMYNPETRVYLSIDNDEEIKTKALNVSIYDMCFANYVEYSSEFINVLDDDNTEIRKKVSADKGVSVEKLEQYFSDNVLNIFKEEYKEFSRKLLLLDNNTL